MYLALFPHHRHPSSRPTHSRAPSICRKIGTYGYAANLGGINSSLVIHSGKESIKIYKAIKDRGGPDEARCNSERNFCGECSSMLWLHDSTYPELIHPFSSAIDSKLPTPPEGETVAIMAGSKPDWVKWPQGVGKVFKEYPEESLEQWHKRNNLWVE
jgi:hypothetical protein